MWRVLNYWMIFHPANLSTVAIFASFSKRRGQMTKMVSLALTFNRCVNFFSILKERVTINLEKSYHQFRLRDLSYVFKVQYCQAPTHL